MKEPQTLKEAIEYFSDPDMCFEYVVNLRWQNGAVTCPHCDSVYVSFVATRNIWNCLTCKKQFSIRVGTIFEDSSLGLDKWLTAMWMVANTKNGVSSCEIARTIGVTQKTAWFMSHRVRAALQQGTLDKLLGEVGSRRNLHWRKSREHAQVETRAQGTRSRCGW